MIGNIDTGATKRDMVFRLYPSKNIRTWGPPSRVCCQATVGLKVIGCLELSILRIREGVGPSLKKKRKNPIGYTKVRE